MDRTPGTLILCATPIGNLRDISERLADTLASVDVIFAEDTRRTGQLLAHLGISKPMRSYFAGNERARNVEIVELLDDGQTVALVSDAGMPVVSDPGSSAVAAAYDAGAVVTAIPGPSAPIMAIAVSGFSADRFVFEGFLPRKGRERALRIASLASDQRTTVLFAATRRVAKDLSDIAVLVGSERRVVVTRELTKLHEEVWRGTVAGAAAHWGGEVEPRGEFTIVIEGAPAPTHDLSAATDAALELIDSGTSPSDAVKTIARETGVSKRDLYEMVIVDRESPAESCEPKATPASSHGS
ncbi:MAG: 16S rRNA (cytidine(1402)-2'-O)-methyltransferase [Acidimicrobiia bacterium]|nr:16S rRNA (cytidine(1402)-2'-O)-methyltransferase [Acidimicrobiia bacterium]